MIRIVSASLLLFFGFSGHAIANAEKGTVCLGKNLAKPASEHGERLYLKIDGSKKIYFVSPYRGPTAILKNLDVHQDHTVKVFFDDRLVQSWKLNFFKLKTDDVLILRASCSWRMEPYDAALCK